MTRLSQLGFVEQYTRRNSEEDARAVTGHVIRTRSQREKDALADFPDEEKGLGRRIIDDWCFNLIIYLGIGVNSIQMGLELQFTDGDWKIIWFWMEQFFCLFFTVEMLLKWWGMGLWEYFSHKANWVDFAVVVVAVLDNWILASFAKDAMDQVSFIALLRMARLARILKLLKAKRELMILIEGILSSIRSMFWLSILLAILIYTVAICFVKFIGESDAYPADGFDNKKYFGDMRRACMTGLNLALLEDWSDVIRPVLDHQPFFAFLLMGYVAVSCFGIMNAIIGVIVERTSAASEEARLEDEEKFRQKQMEWVESIRDIVYEIDTDGDGTVSPDEIAQASDNDELIQALEMIELPSEFSLEEVHAMLDKDGDGELTKDEFRSGMRRLIFSNDFQRQCLLMLAMAQQKRKMFQHQLEIQEQFAALESKISGLPSKIAAAVASSLQQQHFPPSNPGMDNQSPKNDNNDTVTFVESRIEKISNRQNVSPMKNVRATAPAWNQTSAWQQPSQPEAVQTPVLNFAHGEANVQQPISYSPKRSTNQHANEFSTHRSPTSIHPQAALPGQLAEEHLDSQQGHGQNQRVGVDTPQLPIITTDAFGKHSEVLILTEANQEDIDGFSPKVSNHHSPVTGQSWGDSLSPTTAESELSTSRPPGGKQKRTASPIRSRIMATPESVM